MAQIKPLGDRVVVKAMPREEVTKSGIVLPDTAKDKPSRGKVISVGEGRLLKDGTRAAPQVSPGDRVLFSSYAGEPFKLQDQVRRSGDNACPFALLCQDLQCFFDAGHAIVIFPHGFQAP